MTKIVNYDRIKEEEYTTTRVGAFKVIWGEFYDLPWILRNGKHKPLRIECAICGPEKPAECILECTTCGPPRPWEFQDSAFCKACLEDNLMKEDEYAWQFVDGATECIVCKED